MASGSLRSSEKTEWNRCALEMQSAPALFDAWLAIPEAEAEAVNGSLVMYMGRIGERSGRKKVGEEKEVRKRRWRNGGRRDGYF